MQGVFFFYHRWKILWPRIPSDSDHFFITASHSYILVTVIVDSLQVTVVRCVIHGTVDIYRYTLIIQK